MIEQLHNRNVPYLGMFGKGVLCPNGHLGVLGRYGHMAAMVPNNISTYRKRAKLTQEQLADMIGTTRDMLAKLEGGAKRLNIDWLEKIGGAIGVPPYLLIAPESFLPTEVELAEMLSSAQQTLPAGLPYSEWPRSVASGLHIRLRTLAGDRASADSAGC